MLHVYFLYLSFVPYFLYVFSSDSQAHLFMTSVRYCTGFRRTFENGLGCLLVVQIFMFPRHDIFFLDGGTWQCLGSVYDRSSKVQGADVRRGGQSSAARQVSKECRLGVGVIDPRSGPAHVPPTCIPPSVSSTESCIFVCVLSLFLPLDTS